MAAEAKYHAARGPSEPRGAGDAGRPSGRAAERVVFLWVGWFGVGFAWWGLFVSPFVFACLCFFQQLCIPFFWHLTGSLNSIEFPEREREGFFLLGGQAKMENPERCEGP